MSTTNNRGGGAKFLALLSSLAMITVGLIGVAFASPANADPESPGPEPKIWVCHADMNKGHGQPNLGEGGTGGEYQVGFNLISISKNAWEAGAKDGHDQHPNDKVLGEYTEEEPTLADCGDEPTVNCPEGQDWDGEQCVTPKKIWICHVPQGQEDKYLLLEVDENAWQEGETAHSQHEGDYIATGGEDPTCSEPEPQTRTVWWCAAEGQATSGNQTYVDDVWTPEYNGGNVSETQLTNEDCTTPPPPPPPPSNPGGGTPAGPPAPTCANDTDRPGFTIPSGQDASWCFIPKAQETAAVVAPATVVAPQAATVPAKKPAKAVLPATVPAGVAVVPGASNLPGSVPAGDGGSQGGTPPWAILLIAAGALGVLAAGSRVLMTRK